MPYERSPKVFPSVLMNFVDRRPNEIIVKGKSKYCALSKVPTVMKNVRSSKDPKNIAFKLVDFSKLMEASKDPMKK